MRPMNHLEAKRPQFPVRAAFAMTINKYAALAIPTHAQYVFINSLCLDFDCRSQGQTLKRVGVYLANECFSHGQFYVAASRVGHPDHIRFALKRHANGCFYTRNVVYREALTCSV